MMQTTISKKYAQATEQVNTELHNALAATAEQYMLDPHILKRCLHRWLKEELDYETARARATAYELNRLHDVRE